MEGWPLPAEAEINDSVWRIWEESGDRHGRHCSSRSSRVYILVKAGWGLREARQLGLPLCVAEAQLRWPLVGDLLLIADSRQWSLGEGRMPGQKQ